MSDSGDQNIEKLLGRLLDHLDNHGSRLDSYNIRLEEMSKQVHGTNISLGTLNTEVQAVKRVVSGQDGMNGMNSRVISNEKDIARFMAEVRRIEAKIDSMTKELRNDMDRLRSQFEGKLQAVEERAKEGFGEVKDFNKNQIEEKRYQSSEFWQRTGLIVGVVGGLIGGLITIIGIVVSLFK